MAANLAMAGASAGAGGLSFINALSRLKNVAASIFPTCSRGAVLVSTPCSTATLSGAAYVLPQALSGVSLNWSCIACTAS